MGVLKVLKVVRNNWKKSLALACISAYGLNYVNDQLKIKSLMKAYCEEALQYEEQPLHPFSPTRHVTVILNPVAKGRKSKDLYEKYVAPIFHCAGLRVSLVLTEGEGEAKNLMSVMDNTDAVVVVGGSGTLHETITGLLRREDADVVSQNMPIGIIPMSKYHLDHSPLFRKSSVVRESGKKVGQVKVLADAAMSVVKGNIKSMDVIQVNASDRGKTVYCFDNVQFGSLHQLVDKISSYWYYGETLKPYVTLIKGSLFSKTSSFLSPYAVELSYTDPCSGCSRCASRYLVKKEEPTLPKRWWSAFIPRKPEALAVATSPQVVDLSTVLNENCGVWKEVMTDKVVNVQIKNSMCKKSLDVTLHPSNVLSKSNIIKEGLQMYRNESPLQPEVRTIEAQDVRINLLRELSTTEQKPEDVAPQNDIAAPREDENWLSIDAQKYEAENLELILLPERIKIYS